MPTADPHAGWISTYRYLRIAMVLLVVALAASVVYEWYAAPGHCLQESISAYYYTPVRGILVGVLVSIGVCLVVLKGSSETEDVLLNVAGMLAPVVALVPVPEPGICRSVPFVGGDVGSDVANNMTAVFVVGILGLVIIGLVAGRQERPLRRSRQIGLAVSTALVTGGLGWFVIGRASFLEYAHYASAIVMFASIVLVVALNALGHERRYAVPTRQRSLPARTLRNPYALIAVAMVVSVVAMVLWSRIRPWDHWVLGVETSLIVLFAVFWVVQTEELWTAGLRSPSPASADGAPSAG